MFSFNWHAPGGLFRGHKLCVISRVRTRAPGLSVIHWIRSGWLQSHIVCLPKPSVPLVSSCCSFRPSSSGPLLNVGVSIYAQCGGNTLGQNQGLAEPKLHAYCRISAVGDNLKSCSLAFPSCYDHIEVKAHQIPFFSRAFLVFDLDWWSKNWPSVLLILYQSLTSTEDLIWQATAAKGQKAIVQFQAFQESDCTIYLVCTGLFIFLFFLNESLGLQKQVSLCKGVFKSSHVEDFTPIERSDSHSFTFNHILNGFASGSIFIDALPFKCCFCVFKKK